MKCTTSGTRRLGALACALWAAAAMSGCMMELDDPTDAGGDEDRAENIGGEQQAVTGANMGGSNLGGANLGGANLSGTNLGGANLGGANLGGANLGGANLGGANLGGNNLGGINMAATNLGGANLGGANLGGANLGGANLASAGLGGSTATGTYPGLGCPVTGLRNLGTDLTVATIAMDIHAQGAAANKLLRSGEDVFTRASSCVVLGIGSASLARLIAQNSGATMYAALRQLPWGFSASAGGAVTLTAWEIVVWGNARYSVFLVVSPTSATYAGVAGFLKAVWRWNAPTSKTLKIGQIGGGQAVQTHTGMMNAGAARLAGTISEKSYLAGELAFVTATTNNQSVNVDFASWARKTDGKSLVLGNVAGAPPWAEGSIMALEMPDGSVSVYFRQPSAEGLCTAGRCRSSAIGALDGAYKDWRKGLRATKPAPLRCAGYLFLNLLYSEAVPAGKCDPYLSPGFGGGAVVTVVGSSFGVFGAATWTESGSANTPHTDFMVLDSPTDTTNPVMTSCTGPLTQTGCATGFGPYPVISETYIHLWDAPYTPYP